MALFVAKGESGSGFQRLPEGKHVLMVKGVEFDEQFFTDTIAVVNVLLTTKSGITHKERFNIAIDGGAKAFTFLIKTIHNRFDIKEGDSLDELVHTAAGRFIEADVEWVGAVNKAGEPITTKDGEQLINVRLNNKKPSSGWEIAKDEIEDIDLGSDIEVEELADFEF